ncbi:hypothetical protein ACXR0O_14970 [Verrucomicrobiota bacterium sgz303538]
MSNSTVSKIGNYELLALRSDGFIDAERGADKRRVLLRKVELQGADKTTARTQFESDRKRAAAFSGPSALQLIEAFETEEAFVFALSHFEGRAVSTQLLRGKRFSFEEALKVALAIARTLGASNTAHGALVPANVLIDDKGDVRLAPPLHVGVLTDQPAASLRRDMRQLALLVGQLAFGEVQALPDHDPRLLTRWIVRPEVPVRFRSVLQFMLSPAGIHYLNWRECVRDLQRAVGGGMSPITKSIAALATVTILTGGGAWVWQNHFRPETAAPQVLAGELASHNSPEPEAQSKPDSPEETPAPVPEAEDAKPAVAAVDGKALLEYTRVAGPALTAAANRDYAGAIAQFESWSAANGEHPYHEAAERQVTRIQLAKAALAALGKPGSGVYGAEVVLSDKTQATVTKIEGERVTIASKTQFGTVERTVELSTLPDATVAMLLHRLDSKGESAFTPVFLLADSRFTEARALLNQEHPDDGELKSWADDWEKIARDRDALAGLENVATLADKKETVQATRELQRILTIYGDTEIITVAMKENVSRLQEQLGAMATPEPAMIAKTSETGQPQLPVLRLDAAVPMGDPVFQQVVNATRWVVEHGGWDRHREALDQSLANAAKLGTWNQYAKNLERILAQKASALMLAQTKVVRSLGAGTLEAMGKEPLNREFLTWLFTNPRAMQMLAATLKPQDKSEQVLKIWRQCWMDNKEDPETYMALALAVAVVFDDPITVKPEFYGYESSSTESAADEYKTSTNVDALERYRFFRNCAKRGALRVPLSEMEADELVWVVDSPVPNSELEWAQKHVNLSRRSWAKAYGMIRYRMDKAAGGRQIYDRYTLEQIEEEGGICGDQAYFAAQTAKANGIPAMVIGGEGDRGGHAWFGYKAARNEWNLTAGRYADNFAAGTSSDPQTHLSIKEHELHQLAAPERRTGGWATTERYLQLSDLLEKAKQPELSRIALDAGLRATPKHLGAWNRKLDVLVAAKVTSEEWQREIARMRTAFQKYPDIITEINSRETSYLAANGDVKLALKATRRETNRFERKSGSRTDLILDSVYKEVALAEQSGDTSLPGRIFREALKEKGSEVVAFKSLATRYYEWAKKQNQGRDALRDIERAFERNFDIPEDYFAMGAYRDLLGIVTDLFKKEGLDADVRRLERRAEKIDERRKDIGKRSNRAERV